MVDPNFLSGFISGIVMGITVVAAALVGASILIKIEERRYRRQRAEHWNAFLGQLPEVSDATPTASPSPEPGEEE
jgi:hypothetical protein